MMKISLLLTLLAVALLPRGAFAAASTTLIVPVTAPSSPATGMTCTVAYPAGQTTFQAPVAAGTVIANCTVQPSNWKGTLSLDTASQALFAVNGMKIVVGSAALNPSVTTTYTVTVTATP